MALQFPDYLLPDSVQVVNELKKKTSAEFFVLADTTYGRLDVYINKKNKLIDKLKYKC